MKVAFVMDCVSRRAGGLFDACRRLAQSLQATDNEVRVFGVSSPHDGGDLDDWSPVQVQVSASHIHPKLGYAPAMNARLAAFKPDVVHSHGLWTYSSLIAGRWRNSTRRPEVIHPHGMLDPWALNHSKWKKRLASLAFERRHLQHASCIRALGQSELESIRKHQLRNPVCLIPNGIDLPEIHPIPERQPVTNSQKRILLYLGRLHPKKGIASLIAGWDRLRASPACAQWTLAIAGWDQNGHEQELKDLATRLTIPWNHVTGPLLLPDASASITFLGPRFGREKEDLYQACDAFILPSVSEGLPMVVLEAWAHGKPVLMTPMCNLPEGFAANAAIQIQPNAESTADGIAKLGTMPDEERKEMGGRGRRLVEERFTWIRVASQLNEVNEWLVHGDQKPSFVFD